MRLKKILAILLTAVLLVSSTVIALPVSADGDTTPAWEYKTGTLSGEGTSDSPYLINDAQDLATLAYLVNTGTNNFENKYVEQTADIDLDNIPWPGIGLCAGVTGDAEKAFCGTYDGADFAIKNLYIDNTYASDRASFGLFAHTNNGATISGVNIVSGTVNVTGKLYVGALVGLARNGLTVSKCSNMAAVTVSFGNTTEAACGGLIGYLACGNSADYAVNIEDSYNGGTITTSQNSETTFERKYNVGGLIGVVAYGKDATSGETSITIDNCLNFGDISTSATVANAPAIVAGIVGYLSSYAANASESWTWNKGDATFTNNVNVGNITVKTNKTNSRVGGLIAKIQLGHTNAGGAGKLKLADNYDSGVLTICGLDTSSYWHYGSIAEITNMVDVTESAPTGNYSSNKTVLYSDADGTVLSKESTNKKVGADSSANSVVGNSFTCSQTKKALDLSALSLLSVRGAQYKTDADLGLCVRFVGELNLESFAGIKDIGVCVIWGENTANVSGEHKLYNSLNQMAPEGVITPEGVGYLLAAGVSGVPQNAEITLSFKPYVEFEDGTIAYGAESTEITFNNGAYVAPQA